jgi:succinate dehydrogenase/fumarate reductase flavoprotein subunit
MSGFDIIILIITIVVIAGVIGAFLTNGQKSLAEMKEDYYNNEEAQEVVKLTQELYNKDLRPIVAKKAPKEVKEVKETKSEFPIEQPAKKKRKYYPKKKKTEGN